MGLEWVILGVFIWLSFISEAMTGFGSIVIAITLGSLFFPIAELLPVLVPLSVVMSSVLICKHYPAIETQLLFKKILPFISLGMVLGVFLSAWLNPQLMKFTFACLMLWFAVRALSQLKKPNFKFSYKPKYWQPFWTFTSGITHGLFASGGPLLVYALSQVNISKSQFRATLVSVWLGLNVSYTIIMLVQGRITPVLVPIVCYLPVIATSYWLGSKLHDRVSEMGFKHVIYLLLFVAASMMAVDVLASVLL